MQTISVFIEFVIQYCFCFIFIFWLQHMWEFSLPMNSTLLNWKVKS